MPIQNQMMNDNEARPLRSCLSRHDASNLGDLRYSLLVKIDEDEANGMLLSFQTGLCYLWLYRVVSEVESGVLCHTRLPSPHQRGKNPLGRADQEKATAAPVASRQPNPLDQRRRLYIMNSGTCLYSTVLNPSLIWTIVNSTIIRSFDIGLSELQDLLEVVEHVDVSIG